MKTGEKEKKRKRQRMEIGRTKRRRTEERGETSKGR